VVRYLGKIDELTLVNEIANTLSEEAADKLETTRMGIVGSYVVVIVE